MSLTAAAGRTRGSWSGDTRVSSIFWSLCPSSRCSVPVPAQQRAGSCPPSPTRETRAPERQTHSWVQDALEISKLTSEMRTFHGLLSRILSPPGGFHLLLTQTCCLHLVLTLSWAWLCDLWLAHMSNKELKISFPCRPV